MEIFDNPQRNTDTHEFSPQCTDRQSKKIGILGVGNMLLRDEGFGVKCVERLQELYHIPENVKVLDGGTAGIMLAPFMEDADILYVIDTVNSREKPGSILRFSDRDCRSRNMQSGMSPHQLGLLEVLELCRLRGHAPDRVEMITVVPEDLSTGIGLSPRLAVQIDPVIDLLLKSLLTHNISLRAREHGRGA